VSCFFLTHSVYTARGRGDNHKTPPSIGDFADQLARAARRPFLTYLRHYVGQHSTVDGAYWSADHFITRATLCQRGTIATDPCLSVRLSVCLSQTGICRNLWANRARFSTRRLPVIHPTPCCRENYGISPQISVDPAGHFITLTAHQRAGRS